MHYGGDSLRFAPSKQKNQKDIEKEKIIFQFTLITTASFIAGILFINMLSDNYIATVVSGILKHFSQNVTLKTFGKQLIDQVLPDIICVALLYIFSFSFINYFATDIILAFLGMRVGIYVCLCVIARIGVLPVILKLLITILILIYACQTAIYSLSLKKILPNGRVSINIKAFLIITLLTVSMICLALVLSAVILLL